jgi:hypothetical protein
MRYFAFYVILGLGLTLAGCQQEPKPTAPAAPTTETAAADTLAPSAIDVPAAPAATPAPAKAPKVEAPAPSVQEAPPGAVSKNRLPPPPPPAEMIASGRPNHSAWNALLQQYVSAGGQVNYSAWRNNMAPLEAYLADLAAWSPKGDWLRPEQMAYWINAYNAFTVKLMLDNPTSSIQNLHGGKPWDVKWIRLGDRTYSLNEIENDILRPRYKDARIHFAVNCAAKSCPPLANRAFTAENLNRMLDQQTRNFINNDAFNTFAGGEARVSKIFDWYSSDFGDLRAFLSRYRSEPLGAETSIRFNDYDWALNGR